MKNFKKFSPTIRVLAGGPASVADVTGYKLSKNQNIFFVHKMTVFYIFLYKIINFFLSLEKAVALRERSNQRQVYLHLWPPLCNRAL